MLKVEHFQKKMTLIADVIPKLRTPKNVKGSTFTIFFDHVMAIQLEKTSLSYIQILKTVC